MTDATDPVTAATHPPRAGRPETTRAAERREGELNFGADDNRVAVAGDWHGNILWLQQILPRLHRYAPDVQTVLHVGDFGIWPERRGKGFLAAADYWSAVAGIKRIVVTPGNHEDWGRLTARFGARPGEPIQLSEAVWVLPRAFRFAINGTTFVSFGGAASVDASYRTPGRTWWAEEMPNEGDVERAIAGGYADVMISHEAVNGGSEAVERVLDQNPMGWDDGALEYSARSRRRVTEVWDGVNPKLLVHGHMHTAGSIQGADGRRVYSLGCDGQRHNVGLLELAGLEWEWLPEASNARL